MKKNALLLIAGLVALMSNVLAQEAFSVYKPESDALMQIKEATERASAQKKQVLLIVGGNWCKWCRMLDKFCHSNNQIDSLLNADYIVEHINFSKENKNDAAMALLGFPQRFGFPVMVILNSSGERIHTQNTGYLEEGEGYSSAKLEEFLKQWNRQALNPDNYKK